MKPFKTLFWSLHSRFVGSRVDLNTETATELSSRAIFPVDDTLMRRIAEKRARLPITNNVKALR